MKKYQVFYLLGSRYMVKPKIMSVNLKKKISNILKSIPLTTIFRQHIDKSKHKLVDFLKRDH